jgi:hypothetical protein
MKKERIDQINQILSDLQVAKTETSDQDLLYAIEQNITFFEATKSFPRFVVWVFTKMSKIDKERLLEINDILPKWDKEMHIKLMEIEQRKFPGLIRPLVEEIVKFIKARNSPLVLVDVGSGGMETERQVLEILIAEKYNKPLMLIGIDQSNTAHEIAGNNLGMFKKHFQFYSVNTLDNDSLQKMRENNKGFALIHCKNNIFDLDKIFPYKVFDLSYHSLFKHHLNIEQQNDLDRILTSVSKNTFEYDGFRSNISLLLQIKNGWNHLAFLNASVFSNLRFDKQRDLISQSKQRGKKVSFFKHTGNYLMK